MDMEELMRKVEVEKPELKPKGRRVQKRPEPMVSRVTEPGMLDIRPPTQLRAEETAKGASREIQLKPPMMSLPQTVANEKDLEELRKDIAENIVNFEGMLYKGLTDNEMSKIEYGSLYRPIKMGMDIIIKDANLMAWLVVLMILTSQAAFIGMHWGEIQEGIERRQGRRKKKQADATAATAENPPAGKKEKRLLAVV